MQKMINMHDEYFFIKNHSDKGKKTNTQRWSNHNCARRNHSGSHPWKLSRNRNMVWKWKNIYFESNYCQSMMSSCFFLSREWSLIWKRRWYRVRGYAKITSDFVKEFESHNSVAALYWSSKELKVLLQAIIN